MNPLLALFVLMLALAGCCSPGEREVSVDELNRESQRALQMKARGQAR